MKCLTKKKKSQGNSLEGQWLGLRDSTAGDTGSIPAWGAKILRAAWCGQKKKKSEGEQRDKLDETTQGPKRTSQQTGHSTEMGCFCKKLRAWRDQERGRP